MVVVTFSFHDVTTTMPPALWWHDPREPEAWFPLVPKR
jgi:hypothetical protein